MLEKVRDAVVPPLANYGRGLANIPIHMLPMDSSIVGTMHSHPSGSLTPSYSNMNHFFGAVLIVVGYPYANEGDIASYNRNGDKLTLRMMKTKP